MHPRVAGLVDIDELARLQGVGDVNINPSGGTLQLSTYGTLTSGQWTQFKIPLSALMTDATLGQQTSFYKADLQITNGGAGQIFWLEWYFS